MGRTGGGALHGAHPTAGEPHRTVELLGYRSTMLEATDRLAFELNPQTSWLGENEGVPVRPARSLRAPDSR
jgi:hypothetical protein